MSIPTYHQAPYPTATHKRVLLQEVQCDDHIVAWEISGGAKFAVIPIDNAKRIIPVHHLLSSPFSHRTHQRVREGDQQKDDHVVAFEDGADGRWAVIAADDHHDEEH